MVRPRVNCEGEEGEAGGYLPVMECSVRNGARYGGGKSAELKTLLPKGGARVAVRHAQTTPSFDIHREPPFG